MVTKRSASATVGVALACLVATSCSSGRVTTHTLPAASPSSTPAVTRPVITPRTTITKAPPRFRAVAAALREFDSCSQLLQSVRSEALNEVTPYGLETGLGYGSRYGGAVAGPVPAMAAAAAPGGAAPGGGSTSGGTTGGGTSSGSAVGSAGFSGTNNQEAGVDEPDLVKTDGSLMVIAGHNGTVLQVLDVSGSKPRQLGRLAMPSDGGNRTLLLTDHTVIALGQSYHGQVSQTTAQVISLADPAHPRTVRTFSVPGQMLDARFVHDRVVLVTQSAPSFAFVYPQSDSRDARTSALHRNRAVINRAGSRTWLPAVTVAPGGRTYPAECTSAAHPGVASGSTTTSIVTLDPAQDAPTQNRTIVGGSSVLYASQAALYLATTSWESQRRLAVGSGRDVTTDLHGFDLTDPDHLTYLGTGEVQGSLIDQYSLSEDNGYLRVATTIGDPIPPTGEGVQPAVGRLSDNRVTVLKPTDGVLTQVGLVRGLGRGQRIFGVRFLGDVGYVVTFRTIDPLYVLDLKDPTTPTVKGALHISGYSSALYPLADGQLLGIGQAVGSHQQQLGAQAEVFDVHRLTTPRLTGKLVYKDAMSSAQDDHHALLWWAPSHLVVMPLQSYRSSFSGSLVLKVGAAGQLTEIGRISPPHQQSCGTDYCDVGTPYVARSVVVGDLLYSVTDSGIVTNPISEVARQTWLPLT